jgi:hypothetical protein
MYAEDVCRYIKEIHNTDQSYVSIKLDMDTIQNLHLNTNPAKVKHAVIFGSVRIMYVCMNNWTLIDERYATRCAESSERKVAVLCMYVSVYLL